MDNQNKKNTNDKLARMIKTGFDNTPTKQQFESLENKVSVIEKDIKEVKTRLTDFVEKYDEEKLPMRVEYIENVLNIPKK